LAAVLRSFPRQALHAHALTLQHPATRKTLSFTAPLPDDMRRLLDALTADARQEK
jgi:23S rRNA pseudouridine1911/1915/1917 synthase